MASFGELGGVQVGDSAFDIEGDNLVYEYGSGDKKIKVVTGDDGVQDIQVDSGLTTIKYDKDEGASAGVGTDQRRLDVNIDREGNGGATVKFDEHEVSVAREDGKVTADGLGQRVIIEDGLVEEFEVTGIEGVAQINGRRDEEGKLVITSYTVGSGVGSIHHNLE